MGPSIARQRVDQVYLAAARVGGIHANNSYPADFIHQNLVIEANLIHAAHRHGVHGLTLPGLGPGFPAGTTEVASFRPGRREAALPSDAVATTGRSIG